MTQYLESNNNRNSLIFTMYIQGIFLMYDADHFWIQNVFVSFIFRKLFIHKVNRFVEKRLTVCEDLNRTGRYTFWNWLSCDNKIRDKWPYLFINRSTVLGVYSILKCRLITDWSVKNMKITKEKMFKKIGLQASKFNNIGKGALHLRGFGD